MFYNCSSLTSLNLSNFYSSQVTHMNITGHPSLTSLNLSNFNISQLVQVNNMFDGCINLEYINLKNFNEISLSNYWSDMFNNVPNNIAVCININNIKNKIYPQINNKTCHIEDCTNNWKLNQKKFVNGTNDCITDCSDRNLYEYNGECVSQCPNGNFTDENNITKCKCELEKCLACPTVALNKGLCTKCNDNYYPMENDPLNLGEYSNCYKEKPNGYYLDTNDTIYKRCYHTFETCEIKGDNQFQNCLKCNTEFIFGVITNNYFNCYQNCSYYNYFDNSNNNYHCTKNLSCPQEYPHLIEDRNECILQNIKVIENFIDDIFQYETGETNEGMVKEEEEINKYNEILHKIEFIFTSDNYDLTNIDKGEDQVIKAKKMVITLTNTENQKNNLKSNISTIDLGDCEKLLRKYYNLTNQTIY